MNVVNICLKIRRSVSSGPYIVENRPNVDTRSFVSASNTTSAPNLNRCSEVSLPVASNLLWPSANMLVLGVQQANQGHLYSIGETDYTGEM